MAALQAGQTALARGDADEAVQWLERACRFAPEDPAPLLSLATARLAAGDPAAALDGFRLVARRCDVREARLGEAVACLRLGRAAEAAAALGECLARHRWDGSDSMPRAVVTAARLPGWCALAADGTVAVGLRDAAGRPRRPSILVDGQELRGAAVPAAAARIEVALDGARLLGSPIDADAICRAEGVVWAEQGGISGWAWHPCDAARDPVLTLTDGVRRLSIVAADQSMSSPRPLSRPRRFVVTAAALSGFVGPIGVAAADGRDLAGSPLDPDAARRSAAAIARMVARCWPLLGEAAATPEAGWASHAAASAALSGWPASAAPCPQRPVAVVIPVYRGMAETLACIAATRRTLPAGGTLLAVDDASPEPELAAALDALAAAGALRLLRLPRNLGFPGAANAGMRAAAALPGGADIVLLNSDAQPTPGWLDALRAAVHSAADIGTACPLSNDATILTYPDPDAPAAPPPAGAALAALARQAARANPGALVDVPTAVGFCMYVRRECLEQTGVFRTDLFGQGYGEENDFSIRARHLGWRHVAVPAAYVAHHGGRSFGAARAALIARNLSVLEGIHPGYHALVAEWIARDPLGPARRRIDALRWAASCRRATAGAVLLVTHESGGGVERCVQARAATLRAQGLRPLLLRPVLDRSGDPAALERSYLPRLCRIDEPGAGRAAEWCNLRFRLPDDIADLAALLRAARPVAMEVHHLLGHDHAVLDLARLLGVPYEMRLHDYAWFCPRISLMGPSGRYCGEPDVAGCTACVADLGSRLEEAITVPALLARSAADLAGASQVIAPSVDAAQRLARHFPAIRPRVEAHEPDEYPPLAEPAAGVIRRVCVVGAIGPEKGYDVLLACARDAAARDLALEFCLVGHSVDDARLLQTGRVRITGPFDAAEAEALIRAQRADLGFIPSVWPETWCLALGEAWRAGLAVAAFDLGAPAERIRATGRGWLLPLGLPATRVNNALLTLAPLASRGRVMQTSQTETHRHAAAPP